MLEAQRSGQPRPTTPFHPAISISDDGLVCGAGSTLVRMARTGSSPRLMVEGDTARLVAMLSVAFNRRVSAAEIVPHVSAAAEHWARGDKAVANFRLTFARLPCLRDAADAERLRLAECALDHGLSPDALMKELGFAAASTDLRRYREDQPRVPAGFGDQGGRWTDDPAFASPQDGRTRVAEELPDEDEKDFETRRLGGETSRQEDIEHGRGGLLDTPGLPRGIGVGPYAGEPIPAGPRPRPSTAQKAENTSRGYKYGCHTCGTKDPGTLSGQFHCDHQPSTSLCDDGTPQYYYPHCASCSARQGGLIRKYKQGKMNDGSL